MHTPTKEEIEKAVNNLYLAMIRKMEASKLEEKAKKEKIKAHYELSKAREAVRELNQDINY